MGSTQSSAQKCLIILRVNETSKCFPYLSPFIHAITKYNTIPIQSEEDIPKMGTHKQLELEILDLRNTKTKQIRVSTPLGIGVKLCEPRLISLKVLEVSDDSPAARKLSVGDFVIGIENFYFETNDEFFYTIYRNRGRELNFIAYRDCKVRRVPILLKVDEPFLGVVVGEGILMFPDIHGDVTNIGTCVECPIPDSKVDEQAESPNEFTSSNVPDVVQESYLAHKDLENANHLDFSEQSCVRNFSDREPNEDKVENELVNDLDNNADKVPKDIKDGSCIIKSSMVEDSLDNSLDKTKEIGSIQQDRILEEDDNTITKHTSDTEYTMTHDNESNNQYLPNKKSSNIFSEECLYKELDNKFNIVEKRDEKEMDNVLNNVCVTDTFTSEVDKNQSEDSVESLGSIDSLLFMDGKNKKASEDFSSTVSLVDEHSRGDKQKLLETLIGAVSENNDDDMPETTN